MKSTFCLLAFLPFILLSCSGYQKVSLLSFEEYKLTSVERENLQYVLKTHKLHYSDIDKKYNIVIPTGANGVCVNSYDDILIIDFGKGVLVPFKVYTDDNKAKSKIEVDEREYSLEPSILNVHLYFDTRGLQTSK